MNVIRDKLGVEWKFVIDWAGIRKTYPERLVVCCEIVDCVSEHRE